MYTPQDPWYTCNVHPAPDPEVTEKYVRLVQDALDRLPQTTNGIARYFMGERILGTRQNSLLCPVSRYLQRELPGADSFDVLVGHARTRLHSHDCDQCQTSYNGAKICAKADLAIVTNSAAVQEFVRLFDTGACPALDESYAP